MRMESSEEEDDFPAIESVTPQSKIDTVYQSKTEKGIRKICFELLDLKDAVETLCGNTQTKYSAILRLCEEVVEAEHELNDLQKHISAHRILLHDLMTGVSQELEEYARAIDIVEQDIDENVQLENSSPTDEADHRMTFLENIDVLLVERKIDEVIEAIDAEERRHPDLKASSDTSATEQSSFRAALLKRKSVLENQLVEITEQPSISVGELKKALSSLLKLGKGSLAHQLLLKSSGSRLQKSVEAFLPLCPCYPETYSASLSNLVFSSILLTAKESVLLFGDNPVYVNKIVQWAESEIESFVRLAKEHAPASDSASALHAASVCVQASLNHCAALEPHGFTFSELLLVLLQPYVEEVLELNFRRARKQILDFSEDECMPLSPRFASPLTTFGTPSESVLVQSGIRFIYVIKEIVEQLTHMVILHFGGNVLTRISHLFEKYVDMLVKALPSTSEDDNLTDLKDAVPFKAETDSQQFALLGAAFTIAEELLPMVVSKVWNVLIESKEAGSGLPENSMTSANNSLELKDWRRQLQHSLDKLKNYFCLQYIISFIYSRDDNTRLDAKNYIRGEKEDMFWVSDPLPTLPFQALFAKLQQLATVAGDVLLGREKVQRVLLARLTETVVFWLSQEQEFWSILEDESAPLTPLGLQQLILDMHFTVEIARYAGYRCRSLHQLASSINARAIKAFSAKGVDPQSALPEDEWFVETAKNAINKFLHVASASDTSDCDEDHIILHEDGNSDLHDEVNSDSDGSPSSLSSIESSESFASAEGELESPNFSDTES
ncbi:OLC1v1025277C1 [Oldenlandia corymbosa var. corymbosa]|uniref:OLC1v1025277C1 n=1 Tax=Oldenlandia corymbosa var. corymbosa TaxID=529605 RepID=A0AAV1C4P9_OLDCO|nr:OLC1v1025277C1 [Oldenlandia corymbosa var. corymbosa]